MAPAQVRHVVAWRRPVQWALCLTLWMVFALAWFWPALHLPLRSLVAMGLAAALCRTVVLTVERGADPAPSWMVAVALIADTVLLTGLLDITGGPFNPFLVIFIAYVWLAAVQAGRLWSVAVAMAAAGAFGWLVVDHLASCLAEHHGLTDFPTHLFVMWFVGATIAELVGHYVGRAREALAQRQEELERARERAARSDRLTALITLAAGAAHELSTPLSTIAVAARELERTADRAGAIRSRDLREDVTLIKDAIGRCRGILDGMSGRATGQVSAVEPMVPAEVAAMAAASLPEDHQRRLDIRVSAGSLSVIEAGVEVSRAISSLLKNAFDASGEEPVRLQVSTSGGMLRFEVIDSGHGMPEEVRRRAGEPFFTTKAPGEGLGLGLFLARAVAEQSGGSLRFESANGTTAILEIPATMAAGTR